MVDSSSRVGEGCKPWPLSVMLATFTSFLEIMRGHRGDYWSGWTFIEALGVVLGFLLYSLVLLGLIHVSWRLLRRATDNAYPRQRACLFAACSPRQSSGRFSFAVGLDFVRIWPSRSAPFLLPLPPSSQL